MSETTDTSADAKAAQSIYSPLIHQKAIPFNSIQLRCQSQARKLIDLHCRTICSRQTFCFPIPPNSHRCTTSFLPFYVQLNDCHAISLLKKINQCAAMGLMMLKAVCLKNLQRYNFTRP